MHGELMQPALAPGMLFGGLVCGYLARKTGLVAERWSRPLHLINILVFQANICWMTMWGVTWEWGLVRLPVAGLILSVALTLLGLAAGRVHRFDRRDRVTFALCCGMSNLGSTGGLLVIRVLVSHEAFEHGLVFLLYWTFFAFLFCFPLAKHYGSATRTPLRRLILGSLVDIRMLPLAGLIVGLALNGWGPAQPKPVVEPIVSVMLLCSGFAAMFAIGVALHLSKIREFVPVYLTQGVVKFIIGPAIAAGLVLVVGIADPMDVRVVLIQASLSQAFYSVMFANILGLNLHLANSMFLVNTIGFLVVVFPILTLLV